MRATSFMSPSDTLKASLNALTSSLVMTPSALAIFALRAITPTVKGSSLSADRSRGSRSTWAAPPNSVPIEAPTDDSATADASLSQMDIEILPNYRLMQSIYHEAKLRRPSLKQIKPDSPVSWGIIQSEYFYARGLPHSSKRHSFASMSDANTSQVLARSDHIFLASGVIDVCAIRTQSSACWRQSLGSICMTGRLDFLSRKKLKKRPLCLPRAR